MNDKMSLNNLDVEARRLVRLLENRQPGLHTWLVALDITIKAIIDETGYYDYQPKATACPRCGLGKDTNGDGDCVVCHSLTIPEVAQLKGHMAVMRRARIKHSIEKGE
jgi:hypothetical protein